MAILPEDIPTGKVTGQFYFVNEDTIEDPDLYPQLTVVTGFVRFKASIKVLRMSARKAVVIPLTFDAKFNSEGKLVPADHLDSPEGIYLPATDSTEFDTTGWTWTATFEIKDADTGHTIQIDPITFQVPVGSELDLSTIVPAPASPGVITTRGPQGVPGDKGDKGDKGDTGTKGDQGDAGLQGEPGPQGIQGIQGEQGVQGESGPQGLQGLPGNATMRVDTSVGTRIFLSDGTTEHMIHGDTGIRNLGELLAEPSGAGLATGNFFIRREGNQVTLSAALKAVATDTMWKGSAIPVGYRPANQLEAVAYRLATLTTNGKIRVLAGTLYWYLPTEVNVESFVTLVWTTTEAWPTTNYGVTA